MIFKRHLENRASIPVMVVVLSVSMMGCGKEKHVNLARPVPTSNIGKKISPPKPILPPSRQKPKKGGSGSQGGGYGGYVPPNGGHIPQSGGHAPHDVGHAAHGGEHAPHGGEHAPRGPDNGFAPPFDLNREEWKAAVNEIPLVPQPAPQPGPVPGAAAALIAGLLGEEDGEWEEWPEDEQLPNQPAPQPGPVPIAQPAPAKNVDQKEAGEFNIASFQHRDPEAAEVQIYDEMLNDLRGCKLNPSVKLSITAEIEFLSELFKKRDYFINLALRRPQDLDVFWVGDRAFHAELAKEAGHGGQEMSMKARLNHIHGMWTQSYLKAKRDGKLDLFFGYAFGAEGVRCIDAKTEHLINSFIRLMSVDYKVQEIANSEDDLMNKLTTFAQARTAWAGKDLTAATLRDELQHFVGALFKGKAIAQDQVEQIVDYAENVLMLF